MALIPSLSAGSDFPRRIVCLTDETTEVLYLLGEQDRIVDPAEVLKRNPAVILASWCGMKVNKPHIASRPGWSEIAAVRNNHIYEIKSAYILQPGPAALTEGVRHIHAILARVAGMDVAPELMPEHKLDPDLP